MSLKNMSFKVVIFLGIVGVVFSIIAKVLSFFSILATIAYVLAGLAFLVWLYQKFFGNDGNIGGNGN